MKYYSENALFRMVRGLCEWGQIWMQLILVYSNLVTCSVAQISPLGSTQLLLANCYKAALN